jgi:hypothetical protein
LLKLVKLVKRMPELEERLRLLGAEIEFPPAPLLAGRVRMALAQRSRAHPDRRWLAVAAAIMLVALGALLAFPNTRDAIAGFFGLKGVLIERVPSLASPTPAPPASLGDRLALGRQVSLSEAQASVTYAIVYPRSLGSPDAVFLLQPPDRKAVALVWRPRAGLPESANTGVGALLIEFPGQVSAELFVKMIGPDATLEQVKVASMPGFFIGGRPHGFVFLDAQGTPQTDNFRLAGNTLLWNDGLLTVRIESDLGKEQVLALAGTTR